ncbi:MAG: hypothetical protein KCHDKBKB_02874 [Elusimicrobia bacterium]|nr:hypothetical protein [Elusimicrobiota bacterium]
MKLLLASIAVLSIPLTLEAKCAQVDFATEVRTTPIFARVIIKTSSSLAVLDACMEKQRDKSFEEQMSRCQYSFSAEVKEVFKGTLSEKKLLFTYGYFNGCPATYTFNEGEEYILAIDEVGKDGVAKLHSTACGLGGISMKETDRIKNFKRFLREKK